MEETKKTAKAKIEETVDNKTTTVNLPLALHCAQLAKEAMNKACGEAEKSAQDILAEVTKRLEAVPEGKVAFEVTKKNPERGYDASIQVALRSYEIGTDGCWKERNGYVINGGKLSTMVLERFNVLCKSEGFQINEAQVNNIVFYRYIVPGPEPEALPDDVIS